MATRDEVLEASRDAQLALMKAIKTCAEAGNLAYSAVAYAEAYAWLTSPSQSHGGGPKAAPK